MATTFGDPLFAYGVSLAVLVAGGVLIGLVFRAIRRK